MAEATRLPVKTEKSDRSPVPAGWHPLETLHKEIDRLFDDFNTGSWRVPFGRSALDFQPFWRSEVNFGAVPAVDVVEKDTGYEITAELPGMDENNVELKVSGGALTIRGEKQEEKEEKKKGYYHSERRFGSFERSFRIPEGVDVDKIEANFKNGVLAVTLPKKPEAQKEKEDCREGGLSLAPVDRQQPPLE